METPPPFNEEDQVIKLSFRSIIKITDNLLNIQRITKNQASLIIQILQESGEEAAQQKLEEVINKNKLGKI